MAQAVCAPNIASVSGPLSSIFVNELLEASGLGNIEAIGYLLNHGFNVNDKALDGQTALCYAVRRDQLDAARFLLDNHAEVSTRISLTCPVFLLFSAVLF
jgi:ankyrin repeat protein